MVSESAIHTVEGEKEQPKQASINAIVSILGKCEPKINISTEALERIVENNRELKGMNTVTTKQVLDALISFKSLDLEHHDEDSNTAAVALFMVAFVLAIITALNPAAWGWVVFSATWGGFGLIGGLTIRGNIVKSNRLRDELIMLQTKQPVAAECNKSSKVQTTLKSKEFMQLPQSEAVSIGVPASSSKKSEQNTRHQKRCD